MRLQELCAVFVALAITAVLSSPATADESSQTLMLQGEPRSDAQSGTQSDTRNSAQRSSNRPAPPRRPSPPPHRLPPNRVRPGGGLDGVNQACHSNGIPLTALLPTANPVYTAIAHPTFLFYLPDTPAAVDFAEFILLSADEKQQIYTTQFVPSQSGIVRLSLPNETRYALNRGEAYRWYLNLHCGDIGESVEAVISVNGWVQRSAQATDLSQNRNESLRPDESIPELWYDEIARVAIALSKERNAIFTQQRTAYDDWESWLTAIGLEDIIDAPIIEAPIEELEEGT